MIKALLTLGAVLILSCGVVVADDSPSAPKSYAAKKAVERHGYAVKKAEQEYQRALAAAKRELIAELERAKAQAMQAKQLEEANAIQASIDAARAELDAVIGKPAVKVRVVASRPWQSAGTLPAGTYAITAKGRWTHERGAPAYGPEGSGKGSRLRDNVGVLMGRIGGREVVIGADATLTVESDDELFFQIGDSVLDDNLGEVIVTIERASSHP